LGAVSEDVVKKELESSHVFALASHHEPLGVAIMEAMAMGMPVVATDSGGVPELIDDGVEGLLLPPQDPERLSDALLRIAREPELAERLGKSAHLKVETHFRSNRSAITLHEYLQK
jgi:glycosyltransferase involved in cell wall biosynthesis